MKVEIIPLYLIDPPRAAARIEIDNAKLVSLAADIAANGLLQPIRVTPTGERYEIVAGHRRYLAHQLMHRADIAAIIQADTRDTVTRSARFSENVHRENLTPMEEAIGLHDMMDNEQITLDALPARVNRTGAWVRQRLLLLQLPDTLKDLVHSRDLPIGCALALLHVTDAAHQNYLARFAVDSGANVRVIEEWVRQWELDHAARPDQEPTRPQIIADAQQLIITVPCYLCRAPTDYRKTLITRVCGTCNDAVNSSTADPPPADATTH